MIVERDGPCVLQRLTNGRYVFICADCRWSTRQWSRRDAEDLFDRHTHGEEATS